MNVKRALPAFGLVSVLAMAADSRAANPTTAQCLAASDATFHTNTLLGEREQLTICASRACPKEIRDECKGRLDEVGARIPTVVFTVTDSSGAAITAVKITVDNQVMATHLDGRPVSIEPGSHLVAFEVAGQFKTTRTLNFKEGEKDRHETIVLGGPEPSPALPEKVDEEAPAAERGRSEWEPQAAQTSGPYKIGALVAGSLGAVGLVVGLVSGALTLSKKSAAEASCPGAVCPTERGLDAWNQASTFGNVSTAGFVTAAVGGVTFAALWLSAPTRPLTRRAAFGFGPGRLTILGTF
jgi:hypothetical protein